MLVHIPSYNDREAFILNCDDRLLGSLTHESERMARSAAGQQAKFVIGGQGIVSSPPGARIFIVMTDLDQSVITRHQYELNWQVSRNDAIRFGMLARVLHACKFPAHQYLETNDPDAPLLMLSKDEYDRDSLMAMSKLSN